MDCFLSSLPCLKIFKHKGPIQENDLVIKEERIAFFLNKKKILSVMSLPSHQDAHIVGFLLGEGVLERIDEIQNITISPDGLSVYLEANIQKERMESLHQEKTLTSGCCVGVTANFEGKVIQKFLESQNKISSQMIWDALTYFEVQNPLFQKTGCIHRAILFKNTGEVLFDIFDIGRHNAIDKVAGLASLQGINLHECFLFASGRLSLEMVIKVVMHEIPIVISKASTTKTAILAAQRLGVTLIGFARNERCNIYTHPSRIVI